VDRRIYRHLRKLGAAKWILFPLQKFQNKEDLLVAEKTWMHSRRGHLINNPFNWIKHPKKWDPKTKKFSKKNHPDIRQHQKERTTWRQQLQQHT